MYENAVCDMRYGKCVYATAYENPYMFIQDGTIITENRVAWKIVKVARAILL